MQKRNLDIQYGNTNEEEIKNGYTFGGNRLASVNNRAKNGLLHKLESSAEYNYNIWEYLKKNCQK